MNIKRTVLICDDNLAVHISLTSYLTAEGMEVLSSYSCKEAENIFSKTAIDVIILDIVLPDGTGFDICRKLRQINKKVYIIMLSAKGEEIDRIAGLEIGADDYVVKPFSPREVAIRIVKAVDRLDSLNGAPKRIAFADLVICPDSYEIFSNGTRIDMTPKEFETLSLMVASPYIVFTREHILNAVWGYEFYGNTRSVDAVIKRLRKKLDVNGVRVQIRSVYGIGYKIEEIK